MDDRRRDWVQSLKNLPVVQMRTWKLTKQGKLILREGKKIKITITEKKILVALRKTYAG